MMGKKYIIFLIVCALVIVILIFIYWHTSESSSKAPPANETILQRLPISELSVYSLRFMFLTDAQLTKDGNWALRIATAGLAGSDAEQKILLKGAVDVRYGLDLQQLRPEDYSITDSNVEITLPAPTVMGQPSLVSSAEDAVRVVGKLPEDGWWNKYSVSDIESRARITIQEDAKHWPERFGVDSLARKRIEQVVKAFLSVAVPGKEIKLRFRENQSQQGGDNKAAGTEKPDKVESREGAYK